MMASKCAWVKLLLFMFVFILNENCCSEGCQEEERLALFQIKHFFNYSYRLKNWMMGDENSDCCLWKVVECSNTTGRVKELYLSFTRNWELEEWYLNASLFSPFQELELLDLHGNNIAGFVENEGLSSLTNLKFLNLSFNMFNNSILSSLDGLSSLATLSLSDNRLEGSIDIKGFGSLASLKELNLSYNQLREINNLNGLSKLESLDLSGNTLNRTIFSSLSGLSSLKALHLSRIRLEGTFDVKELDSLSNLEMLRLSLNAIDKFVVPKDYRGLKKLNSLYLERVGNISDGSTLLHSLGSFPSLKTLALGYNNFTETVLIPKDLQNFANLEDLMLDGCSFHISLVQSLTVFNSLKRLSMLGCKLHGISKYQGHFGFKNLEYLNMHGTALNNSFLQISRLMNSSLKVLYLSSCGLKGTLSNQGLCELVYLEELYIFNNDLVGILPWCLANMTSLRVLDVSFNQLTGDIISSPLVYLTYIQDLTLSNNHFQIPISLEPFYNHSNLIIFDGDNNQILVKIDESQYSMTPKFQLISLSLRGYGDSGTIPNFLYHQRELKYVDLSRNNLTGDFPNWLLENNTKLEELILANNSLSGLFHLPSNPHWQLMAIDVSDNFIRGHIPLKIGEFLPSLMDLNISRNVINGSIPSSFGNMNSLKILDLSNNQLTGRIPEHLAINCFSLRLLVLSNNNLQGHIFSKSLNLRNLVMLQLDGNHFIGEISECLSNSSLLEGLYLSDNHLLGRIPRWLGNLSRLVDIMMPNNHLEGPIPTEFCQLDFLQVLDLSNNSISGSLPSCFSRSIEQVHLSRNNIEGQIKDVFLYSSSMVTLDLSYNRLNGSISNWIDGLSQLNYLVLSNNNFEGEVPVQFCQLRLVDLSRNNLSGRIPACLVNTASPPLATEAPSASALSPFGPPMRSEETIPFTTKHKAYYYQGRPLDNMFGIDLSCNKLTGEIPPQIGYLTRIRALNLSHNNLTGSIPATFENLKQIESLDLSYNNLSGKILSQLVELNALADFSVAYNNLSGKTPEWTAQFATFNESSYEGNPFLCGLPLRKSCNVQTGSPPSESKGSISDDEDNNLIDMDCFYITFAASYISVILGITAILYVNPYWRRRWFYLVEMWMIFCYYFVIEHLIPTLFWKYI